VLAAIVAGGTPPDADATTSTGDADEDAPTECPNCGKPMQKRVGRFGAFWGCTGYPECKTIVDPKKKTQAPPDPDFSMPCPRPNCDGTVTAKRSWRGTVFYGCSNYNAKPKCEYVSWGKPDPEHRCETCGYPTYEKVFRGKSQGWKCTNVDCPTNPPVEKKGKTRGPARSTSATHSTTKSTSKATSRPRRTTK
jgi:DNA topoisomerase-1